MADKQERDYKGMQARCEAFYKMLVDGGVGADSERVFCEFVLDERKAAFTDGAGYERRRAIRKKTAGGAEERQS